MTKVIVAGGRDITDRDLVYEAIESSEFEPTTILSGGADGVDSLGEQWARENGIGVDIHEANWDKHGNSAGPRRNQKMAAHADALILVWDGESMGSRSMFEKALNSRLDIEVEPVGYSGVIKNNITEEDVMEKFPEIKRIDDVWIRSQVITAMIEGYPDYNWTKPSASRYHPPDERGEYGQWLHVKRVYKTFEDIARTYREQGLLSKREVQLGKAAIFLHDMFKYGIPPSPHSSYGEHDTLAAEYVRNFTALPEPVVRCCDTHNGAWANETKPESDLEGAVHLADYFPSRAHTNQGVYDPPKEFSSISEDIIKVED